MSQSPITPTATPSAPADGAAGREWPRIVVVLILAALGAVGCGASSSTATGAYVVTPSPELARSLQAIRGVEQRWALMHRSLAGANATYDNMAEAWNLVLDAVATAQPPPPGEATGPSAGAAAPTRPDCAEEHARISEELTEVQRALIGRRHRLCPEVLALHGRERELARALGRRAHCAEPAGAPAGADEAD